MSYYYVHQNIRTGVKTGMIKLENVLSKDLSRISEEAADDFEEHTTPFIPEFPLKIILFNDHKVRLGSFVVNRRVHVEYFGEVEK